MIIPLQDAIDEALKSPCSFKHGCVFFTNNCTLSKGFNTVKTHAELAAAKKIKTRRACHVIVVRVSSTGKLGSSKPCKHCVELLKTMRVKNVYYSDSHGNLHCVRRTKLENDFVTHGWGKN